MPQAQVRRCGAATNEGLASLTVEQLQELLRQKLAKPWVRFEKAVKHEITPILYHLRKKLHAPGNRNGETWAAWVDHNLSISRRTCDLWTAQYAEKHRLPAFELDKSTSSKITRGSTETADGKAQISISWVGTLEEEKQFSAAWASLGKERASRIAFDAVIAAAAGQLGKKKPNRSSLTPKRGKEWVQ